jgi:anaerobic dimethyl sulfoxide reductase subunit A
MPQGAWYTPNADGVDTRGCNNVLTKYHPTPLAKGSSQHTILVAVEKI